MKNIKALLWSFFLLLPFVSFSQDSIKTEKALKIVPLITSSPLMGFGAGFAVSYLYNTDEDISSKSQLQIGGQYSTSKSYNIFVNNNAWFNDNKLLSSSVFTYAGINNDFEIDGEDIEYNSSTSLFAQGIFFKMFNDFYLGVPLSYKEIKYAAINDAGSDFLDENGIVDEKSGGIGISASFDTRKNKFYPVNAAWVALSFNSNPSWIGTLNTYNSLIMNARYYAKGFSNQDVWAWQFYGQYASDKTPDSGLPTLSGKAMLRGYPAGKYKARYMSGAQTEYRYTIGESRFRITGFYGIANLTGGSYGVDGNSRDDDGWYTATGIGGRYALQPKTGVDLRLDMVRTGEGDYAFYLTLNQAF
jgi:hypothetical protein